MPFHSVEQGECLSTLAVRYRAGDWRALYQHPSNADLRARRPNPNVLLPGDQVFVPDPGTGKVAVCAIDALHRFKVKVATVKLRVVLKDSEDKPLAGKKYVVRFGAAKVSGATTGEGLVEVDVPVTVTSCNLSAWIYDDQPPDPHRPDIEHDLDLGHLDPADAMTGVAARLENLGFLARDRSGDDEATRAAARRFRATHRLPELHDEDDPIDDTLRSKLVDLHDGR